MTPPRRTNGRLRKLTHEERAKRQDRRERLNPEREARKLDTRTSPDAPRSLVKQPRRRLAKGWFAKARAALGIA